MLSAGRQGPLALAHLRKGETYADLAAGFGIGLSTTYRYILEALHVLATMAPTLEQAVRVCARKAYVTLDGTLLGIDRVAMASGNDRPYHGVGPTIRAPYRRSRYDRATRKFVSRPLSDGQKAVNRGGRRRGR